MNGEDIRKIRGVMGEMNWGDARHPVVSFTVREIDGEEVCPPELLELVLPELVLPEPELPEPVPEELCLR